MELELREVKLARRPSCPLCGDHPSIRESIDYAAFCGLTVGQHAVSEVEPD